jgi:hypothetical protein
VTGRAQRIDQLSVELAKSQATNTTVEERDIRSVSHRLWHRNHYLCLGV